MQGLCNSEHSLILLRKKQQLADHFSNNVNTCLGENGLKKGKKPL